MVRLPSIILGTGALVAILFCHTSGCRRTDSNSGPIEAYRAYLAAVRSGDQRRIWKHLGPKTKTQLERWAERAHRTTQGTIDLKPSDLLLVDAPPPTSPRIQIVSASDTVATLRIGKPTIHTSVRIGSADLTWTAGIVPGAGSTFWGPLGLTVSIRPALRAQRSNRQVTIVKRRGKWLVEINLPITPSPHPLAEVQP
ncbi:MAG: hypothetical protein J7M25_17690 [Deltaproteobacteria bacterium]|nr:hypothetical protein [Deltaproteobacteria bacterium]